MGYVRGILIAAAVWGLTGCSSEVTDPQPGQPVATRQKLFKTMLREFEPMGVMLRQGPFDAEQFVGHWRRFAELTDQPWPLFRADTCYPPAKVTPQACSDLSGLQQRAETFRAAVAQLGEQVAALEAEGGSSGTSERRAAVKQAYDRVYDACQECHRGYRKK